jgi:hypothetical protein
MASSGNLARSFARALDLPEAVATTAMKVLRFEDMVTKHGRGTSAAMMSAEDAAVFLVAIASGAVPSQIVEVTNFLLDMRKVDTFPPDRKGESELCEHLSAHSTNFLIVPLCETH